jgi:hypothetical protein
MALFPGSRYKLGENGKKITATKIIKEDRTITFLHDRKVYSLKDMKAAASLREVKQGEQIDLIAYESCADELKWWLIADINEMFYPDDEMEKGTRILIPNLLDMQSI